jgi:hypothetical protein
LDPNQMNHMAGAVAGMMGAFVLFGLIFTAFLIFLFWRILTKAGLAGPLSLLLLVPGIGWIIVVCILAFSDWRVAPLVAAPYYPPNYPPPPPAYPPSVPPTL